MKLSKRLRHIALWKKFTALGLLCLAAIAMPTCLYWQEAQKALAFSAQERQGLPQVQFMLNIIQRTQQHRGISARFLQDSTQPKKEQRAKAEDLEEAITAYEIYFDKNPGLPHRVEFQRMMDDWHSLHQKVSHKEITYLENFELHTVLIRRQLDYVQITLDSYQLSLDPIADGYFLIAASLMELPELAEHLSQIRGSGVGLLAKGSMTPDERAQLQALLLLSHASIQTLDTLIAKAVSARRSGREDIDQQYQATKVQYQKVIELARNELLTKPELSYSPDAFYVAFSPGVNSYYSYAHFAIGQLDTILSERIAANKNTMLALLFYTLCSTLLVAFLCVNFVRKLLRQLGGEPHYASEVVQAIARGDLGYDIQTTHPESLLANVKRMQEKLTENDRLKAEFISTVSHELRTPLTAIGGALSLSVSGQLGKLPKPAFTLLDIAQKNSVRLTELINDLLDIDKLSVGKLALDMRIQPLMPIIDDACLSMDGYLQKYGVHIVMGPRFDYSLVNVDARRLRQVMMNLLSNAAKFSRKGDEVIINTGMQGDKVRIEVIDHGQGIPDSFHDKLFKRFSQGDSSDSRAENGAGLGLAIAKDLVQAMQGVIGFTSTVGVGSCFYIELPLEEANSD